jgi:hypothetical protein
MGFTPEQEPETQKGCQGLSFSQQLPFPGLPKDAQERLARQGAVRSWSGPSLQSSEMPHERDCSAQRTDARSGRFPNGTGPVPPLPEEPGLLC